MAKLTPVDADPFAKFPTLTPIEDDPFASPPTIAPGNVGRFASPAIGAARPAPYSNLGEAAASWKRGKSGSCWN
jgi:hypothetical protein